MYSVSCEKELGNRCVTTYLGKKVLLTKISVCKLSPFPLVFGPGYVI